MRIIIPISIVLGILWNFIAVHLLGGKFTDAISPNYLLPGIITGITAGIFTVWSRKRCNGKESILYGVATYYLAIFTYWLSFVITTRTIMCINHGGWTDFDLRDHMKLILVFLFYGTVFYGVILIPLNFLSRLILWRIYSRYTTSVA